MANIVKARLTKRMTDDGLFEMHTHVPIGKEYRIDLDTKCVRDGYNRSKERRWTKEIVTMVDDRGGFDGWMPTELLDWDGKNDDLMNVAGGR